MNNCEHCGGEFKPAIRRPQQRFCSKKCNGAVHVALVSEKRAEARKGRKCAHCDTALDATRNNQKFCSMTCRNAADYEANTDAYLARAKAQRERDPEGMTAYHAARYAERKQNPEWVDARHTYSARHYVANREAILGVRGCIRKGPP